MDPSPKDFIGKSLFERIVLLSTGGGAWTVIIGLVSFVIALSMVAIGYMGRQKAEDLVNLRTAESRQIEFHIFRLSQSMQATTADILVKASKIPDATLRSEILQRTLDLQSQVFELNKLYRDLNPSKRPEFMSYEKTEIPNPISLSLISSALAQSPATQSSPVPSERARFTQEDARLYVMLSVFFVLGVTFIISIVAIFVATNADVLKFSFDTIKTLMGFFIGVATAFLGLPTPPH